MATSHPIDSPVSIKPRFLFFDPFIPVEAVVPWEVWKAFPMKDVTGYDVSNFGRVRSHKKYRGDTGPRIKSPARHRGGHARLVISDDRGKIRSFRVHRLVIGAFSPKPCEGVECRHVDGDCGNNHIHNLRWGTHEENMRDMLDHGVMALGERRPNAILTDAKAAEIRRRRAAGESGARLAREFGVSSVVVCNIHKGRIWKHVG